MFRRKQPLSTVSPEVLDRALENHVASEIFPVTPLDIINAREVVPEAYEDLELLATDASDDFVGDQKLIAALTDLFARCGVRAASAHIEVSMTPAVFVLRCSWDDGRVDVMGGVTLAQAMFRMAQHIVDGGVCTHCDKPTGVARDFEDDLDAEIACWYQMDPELSRFRRSCEGDDDD